MSGPRGDWLTKSRNVKGFLLDMSGVLFETVADSAEAIPGSVEAVKRLRNAGIKVRFCTNESQSTTTEIVNKLRRLGFQADVSEVFSPAPAARKLLKQQGLRPHLLIYPDLLPEFSDVDQSDPNCVVVGDADDYFTYENMNKAFQLLIKLENPVLITMGRGKYYQSHGKLVLDVGAYTKALEYATGVEAIVVGKPAKNFFQAALDDMGCAPNEVVMVGDDIVGDIGGAQACHITGVQVRTGKYRPCDENHPEITPDGYTDNLLQAVDLFLAQRQ